MTVKAFGQRERSKEERRRRIIEAARETFRAKGFVSATTREIAARAGIAAGTLFLYARDKRALLLMVVNDELEAATVRSVGALDVNAPLLEGLLALFAPYYAFWASDPQLSRHALHETSSVAPDGDEGEAVQFHARRTRIVDAVATLFAAKQRAGRIAPDVDSETAGWMVMSIYFAAVRMWLAQDDPCAPAGLERLRALLQVALSGVGAAPGELAHVRP